MVEFRACQTVDRTGTALICDTDSGAGVCQTVATKNTKEVCATGGSIDKAIDNVQAEVQKLKCGDGSSYTPGTYVTSCSSKATPQGNITVEKVIPWIERAARFFSL